MKLVVILALSLALGACIHSKSSSLGVYYDVPEFQLTAQDGQPFDSKVLAGKIWVADFIYSSGILARHSSTARDSCL
jgi:cytochrome oxidase Cu insertion factor (SCO1/SenC/PrrC family)